MNGKLTSGRFWLTIIAGLVFGYCAVTKILTADVTGTILTMVFISYFQRERNGKNDAVNMDKTKSNQ